MDVRNDDLEVDEVRPGDERFEAVATMAVSVLEQDRYLVREFPHAIESAVLAAFRHGTPIGFLRVLIQVVGAAEGRPPVHCEGVALTEAYVEAFGVVASERRKKVGSALQDRAVEYGRSAGCYQMRSRSPVTSTENYALKLAAGYALSPSDQNDSYYFILKL